MIEYRNPIINEKHEIGVLKNDTFEMTQPGFMMAIGVQSWFGNSVKNDSRYIKPWAFNVDRDDDRAYNWKLISMHPCTDEDYEKFYTPDQDSLQTVNIMRESNGLYCIDWDSSDFFVHGSDSSAELAAVELAIHSCASDMSLKNDTLPNEVRDDCINDFKNFTDYFRASTMVIYYNSQRFQSDKFGSEALTKSSRVQKIRIDE